MILKDFKTALGNFNRYNEFTKRKWGSVILYVLLLNIVCSIFTVIIPTLRTGNSVIKGLVETMPDFTLTPGGFHIEETYELDFDIFKLIATNDNTVTEKDFGDSVQGLLIDKEKILVKTINNQMSINISDLVVFGEDFSFTKNDIPLFKSVMIISAFIANVIFIPFLIISFLINGFVISSIAILIGFAMNVRKTNSEFFKMALYSKTLPCILSSVFAVFGKEFNGLLSILLSCVIMFLALRTIKEETIKESL